VNGHNTFDRSIYVLVPLLLVVALMLIAHLIGLLIG
jgi:hypothetical protein